MILLALQVVVSGLPLSFGDEQLREMMQSYGHLLRCGVSLNERGKTTGRGAACFAAKEHALQVVEDCDGMKLFGSKLSVRLRS